MSRRSSREKSSKPRPRNPQQFRFTSSSPSRAKFPLFIYIRLLCFVFIINCKTNNKSLGIAVSTARKTQPLLLVERADGDAGRRADDLRHTNGSLNDGFNGGFNNWHFYNNWNCLYIIAKAH